MNAVFKSVARKIVYVFAGLIILAALLVATTRLLTPILDKHRADVETWATQLLQSPVTIENIQASWYGYQPQVSLNKVVVLSRNTKAPILEVNRIRVFFSIPKSIWYWKPVPSGIMVSGTKVNVIQNEAGEVSVQGLSELGNQPYKQETKFTDVLDALSQQPRLILRNIDILYKPFKGPERNVTLYNLTFKNSGNEHTVYGQGVLHQEIPTEVTLGIQWKGEKVDIEKNRAKIYLYVSGLSLPQWLQDRNWKGWQIQNGILSAKIWANWSEGAFRKVQTNFQIYSLDLFSQTDKSHHTANRLSGNIGWKKDREGKQIIAGDEVLVDLPNHLWPASNFYLELAPDADGTLVPKVINLGYADITDIQHFIFSAEPILPENVKTTLMELKPVGAVQNVMMAFNGPANDISHVSLDANFSQLGFSSWNKYPSVQNLAGNIKWDGLQGDLTLKSNRVTFDYRTLFKNSILLDQLTGRLQWHQDPTKGWTFQATDLQLVTNDVTAKVNGSLAFPANESPIMDMNADFALQKAERVTRYLPMNVFDPELAKWLEAAFLSGEIKSGRAIIKGALKDFPFDSGNGTFLASGDVNNIDLHYAPGWPTLQKVTGKLTFSGRQMVVDADHTQMLDIPLSKVHAIIPYLGDAQPQVIEIQSSDIKGDLSQGLRFIHQSPLELTLGKMFTGIEMQGPMILKLSLSVPLSAAKGTKVDGNIILKDSQMNMVPWRLVLNKINGELHFTEDTTDAKNIQAQLFNKPFLINLSTIKKNDTSIVQADATGNLSISDLESWLKISLAKVAQGSTNVNAQINFALNQPLDIQLKSNLEGVALTLPDQYSKKASEQKDFVADIIVQDQQPLKVQVSYTSQLSAALILTRKRDTFNLMSANIHLGTGDADWPAKPGLYITGNFDQLDWDKIKLSMNQSSSNQVQGLPLRGVDIRAKVFNLFGQKLTQARLQLTPTANLWTINIDSSEVSGQIQAPPNFSTQGQVNAQFDKLNLSSAGSSTKNTTTINAKSLPVINFSVNNFSYNGMPFGQVTFKAVPSGNGLSIRGLRISSRNFDLEANGDWSPGNGTKLQGSATSTHVSEFLTSLGLDVHNFIASKGDLKFNLGWDDAPYAPSLGTMTGTASLNLGPGRIVDVGQASGAKMDLGKMLSLFSLQSIPRRLTFDFSDLFQKGYSFDSVRGDFNLQNGSAFTNNLRFDGTVAKIGINGRIGFKNQDFDLTLTVMANVTSSIPLAATLITGNPVVGLAALGINTVLGSQMSQVTSYNYKVTGPWSNPSWRTASGR